VVRRAEVLDVVEPMRNDDDGSAIRLAIKSIFDAKWPLLGDILALDGDLLAVFDGAG
jgi:hypothetical protein